MGETTDRLQMAKAKAHFGPDRFLNFTNVLIAVCLALASMFYMVGRSVVTRDEINAYVRQDVYARDHQYTTQQLSAINGKLDRVVDALNARP